MEGTLTYSPGSQAGLELPVWEYGHSEGFAVIGGFEYHGSSVAELASKYVYGDYGSGKIWALQYDGVAATMNTLLVDTELNISSFGVDEQHELYFCALNGRIYALRADATPTPTLQPTEPPTPTSTPINTQTPTPNPTINPSSNTPSPSPTITEFPTVVTIAALLIIVPIITLIYKKNLSLHAPGLR